MPAYARGGKVLCFFRGGEKFKERYMTLGFNQEANLDEGHMWPIAFALTNVTVLHDTPSGDSETVSFRLWGMDFMAISAGPLFRFNPSISLMANLDPLLFASSPSPEKVRRRPGRDAHGRPGVGRLLWQLQGQVRGPVDGELPPRGKLIAGTIVANWRGGLIAPGPPAG